MNAQLKMLLWKESRERRGQFLLCLGCLLAVFAWLAIGSAMMFATWGRHSTIGRFHHSPLADAMPLLWLYAAAMPIFVAMRTACGETTDRTAAFSAGLPIAARQAGWLRVASGAVVLAAPVLLLGIAATLWVATLWFIDPQVSRGFFGWELPIASQAAMLWLDVMAVAVTSIGCYCQLIVLGTFVRSENQLALVGALWTIVWTLIAVFALQGSFMPPNRDAGAWEWLSPHALLICATRDPVLSLEMPGFVPWLGAGLLVSTVLAAATAAWFVSRYGRRAGESAGAGRYAWLRGAIAQVPTRWYPAVGKHRPTTQLGAIAWLAMRQALPMCLAGLAIGLVLSVLIMSLEPTFYQHDVFKEATRIFSIVIAMVGVLWASIVGVGSVAEELDGRCGDFWRTRPIPFWWLFSVKFLVGLAAVAIVLDGAALVASWLGGSSAGWDWAYVACLLPFHAAMFAIAVALACWLRRVAIGAMAAVVGYAVFEVLSGMSTALRHHTPLDLYSRFERDHRDGLPIDLTKNGYPTMALVLVLIVVVSFVVAGRTLARYQPRRQMD